MLFRPLPAVDEQSVEVGSIALGYNITLFDSLEMINEISFDIPQDNEPFSLMFMTGFIFTYLSSKNRDSISDLKKVQTKPLK